MTLRDLCEPLFLHVCRLNRSARKGATSDYRQTRSEIEAILADMRSAALSTPGLSEQFERIEVALIFFVDSMIAESQLPFAAEWHENRLAYDRHERAGDEKFFDILEETLVDKSQAATERLGVLYTCLGLGFTGWYAGQHTHLRRKMSEAASRLRREMDPDEAAKICPQAYEHTDTRVLTQPPGAKLVGIAIALAGLSRADESAIDGLDIPIDERRSTISGAMSLARDPGELRDSFSAVLANWRKLSADGAPEARSALLDVNSADDFAQKRYSIRVPPQEGGGKGDKFVERFWQQFGIGALERLVDGVKEESKGIVVQLKSLQRFPLATHPQENN